MGREKNGSERKKMNGKGKKWFGTKKNEWERKKMVRNEKKWFGTEKNEPERKKMVRTEEINKLPGTFSLFSFYLPEGHLILRAKSQELFSQQFPMVPRPHLETNENQHHRFAQHIGPPRRGVS